MFVSMPATMSQSSTPPHDREQHVWIITGPAGCGKTTVARYLANQLSLPYIEGDDVSHFHLISGVNRILAYNLPHDQYHPKSNVQKMAAGIPLDDGDRWDWLIHLRDHSLEVLHEGAVGVVLTCSALKKKYRDVFRVIPYNYHNVAIHFVYLHASESLLLSRVKARKGHFMKDGMVHSQFSSLEEPDVAVEPDCLVVDVSGTATDVQNLSLAAVKRVLKETVAERTFRGASQPTSGAI